MGYRMVGGSRRQNRRKGTSLIELALVFPIFMLFVFALFEFSHALMVSNMLTAVAKQAAHRGSFEGTTTSDVTGFIHTKLAAALPNSQLTCHVKDASTFELSTTNAANVDVASLPNISLGSAESRQLFLVHVEVNYADVALITPSWIKNVTLRGSSVMRRE